MAADRAELLLSNETCVFRVRSASVRSADKPTAHEQQGFSMFDIEHITFRAIGVDFYRICRGK
jgi:hypothetical protein